MAKLNTPIYAQATYDGFGNGSWTVTVEIGGHHATCSADTADKAEAGALRALVQRLFKAQETS